MKQFKNIVEKNFTSPIKILDVGSLGVNGTYKEIFSDEERFNYTGLDMMKGPNVDYVPSDPYKWDNLKDESFDVIISGQTFEHIEFPWLTILEMKRVLRNGGLICIIAPSRGPEHRYPVDCWRYYPDGFYALARWAGLHVIECKTTWGSSGFSDGSDQWGDTFCILRKGDVPGVEVKEKVTLPVINKNNPLIKGQPDYYFTITRKDVIALIMQNRIPSERVLEIGCAGGATARLLKEMVKVREYVGVDISEEAGVLARQFLDRVIIADIERLDLEKEGIKKGYFDLILCLDVLEHLYNPWDVLASLREYLKDEGYLIASIPNIQNISVINNLVNGRWEYEKAGILDATHLRFFTKKGIQLMFEGAGLITERLDYTLNPEPDLSKIKDTGNSINLGKFQLNGLSREEVMDLFTYQYLVTSRKTVLTQGEDFIKKGLTSIVILTFNQLEYTKRCIESIMRNTPELHEIIFVDNGSRDGTVEWLRKTVSENTGYKLVENKENLGFAAGCNKGIKEARGEYILLLNNDVIVTKGWLSGLLDCLKRAPDVGVVGPMTNNISGIQKVEVTYKDEMGIEEFAISFKKRYEGRIIPSRRIVGFCMLFKRELVDRIGLLDETFGTGNFEDDDFCLRAELEGFRNYIAGDVFIHHYGSRSFIGNRIDYDAMMGGNRERFNKKWNALSVDMESREGKNLLCLKIIERAEELFQRGKIDKAIKALIEAIKIEPKNRRAIYSLAEKLIDLKQYEHCLNIIKELAYEDLKVSIFKGYCLEGIGDMQGAWGIVDEVLTRDGNNALAMNLKGLLYYNRGEIDRAIECFKRSAELAPYYGEAFTNLGVIKWSSGDEKEGLDLLEKGFMLSPTVSDIASLYHTAISKTGQYERAERFFEESVMLFPLRRQNVFFFIDVLLKQNKFEEAMDIIEKSIVRFGIDDEIAMAALTVRERLGYKKIKTTHGRVTLSLCMIVKNEEEYLAQCLESVKGIVDEMVIVDTGSEDRTKDIAKVFGARVYDFPWKGDFSEARNLSLSLAEGDWILILDADEVIAERDHDTIKKLIRRDHKKKVAYRMVTRNYMNRIVIDWKRNTGEYKEERGAGWLPSTKVRLFPRDVDVRFEYPVHELVDYSLDRMGYRVKECPVYVHHYGKLNVKKTEKKFDLYYDLGKQKLSDTDSSPKAIYELAIQAAEMGNLQEASELWNRLIQIKPDLAMPYMNLARIYCEIGRIEEARDMARKAVELEPTRKEAHYNLALSCFYLDDIDGAIVSLQNALHIDPEYPMALGLLSVCYVSRGDREKAKEYIEKVKELGFDYPSFAKAVMEKHPSLRNLSST